MVSVEDLTQLKHLNEETLLECLLQRYTEGQIYTFTGPVLLALNPFREIEGLYSSKRVRAAQDGARTPHIFSIAQSAYSGMFEATFDSRGPHVSNQSILISGESGAGKTETTKLVMKYLSLCGHGEENLTQSGIERKILETNPLLEAFGNSRTLRNDNSSRFGKFIQLQFAKASSSSLKLAGAKIETYLLEKVRVSSQSEGERNFHIFYQCCAAAASVGGVVYEFPQRIRSDTRFRLKLNGFTDQSRFAYLNNPDGVEIDDLLDFERTVEALRVIGLSVRDIEELLSIVAAVLHIGNICFEEDSKDGNARVTAASKESLYMACALLGISDPDVLETALITRGISVSAEEGYRTPLPAAKAADVRDAFARFIYGSIFSFLVLVVNETIRATSSSLTGFIGLLDIFGFEYFETNTFEQLCINYANERLQHLFVDHVLRAEQCLYEQEGIVWNRFDFPDNQGVLSLLHHPLTGVLPMLDEECRIVGGNDANYLGKLVKANAGTSGFFSTVRTRKDWFVINHFAGSVAYNVATGFVDKNRDTLSLDVIEVAKQSVLLTRMVEATNVVSNRFQQSSSSNGRVLRPKIYTVSSEFRDQLNRLMETVSETRPLFIRCIKPNTGNAPHQFEHATVLEQLRYGGVLQAVQISRAGFPVRIDHKEFVEDYSGLAKEKPRQYIKDHRQRAEILAQSLGLANKGQLVVGNSKVFMKQAVWDQISQARLAVRAHAATLIQTVARGMFARRAYRATRRALISVQAVIRSAMVVRQVSRDRAAAKIQAAFLAWTVRQYFLHVRANVVLIQRFVRHKLFKRPRKRSSHRQSVGTNNLVMQMEQLGAELRFAKQTMKTVDAVGSRLAYFNSGTPNQSYFAPHVSTGHIFHRRGQETENVPPIVRTASFKSTAALSPSKIGSIEKRVMKVHDDMARMKELIDRIQNNMSDL